MPAPLVKDAFFLPLYTFSSFVGNQVFKGLWINIRVFYSIPLVNFSVFMTIPSCFHYCRSVIEFEVRDGNVPRSSFIYRIVLAVLGFLFFQIMLIIVLSRNVKNFVGILMGIALIYTLPLVELTFLLC